jgi:hypothetical protein
MRGAMQARSSRLLSPISGLRWSSWISRMTRRRRRPTPEQLEAIARLHHQRQRALRMGEHRIDLGQRWIRRF